MNVRNPNWQVTAQARIKAAGIRCFPGIMAAGMLLAVPSLTMAQQRSGFAGRAPEGLVVEFGQTVPSRRFPSTTRELIAPGRDRSFWAPVSATGLSQEGTGSAQESRKQPVTTKTNERGTSSRPNKPVVPKNDLAAKKLIYGLRESFLSWQGYATTGLGAALTEARERDQPQKTTADRAADGLSRYAIDFATRSTKTFFGNGVYPVIFKQSPCYKPSRLPDVPSRFLYAVIRVFVTETDNGGLTVNVSRLAGDLTASALANVYERNTPGFNRIGLAPTFTRFGGMIATDALSLVGKEFTPEIKKLFGRK
jgi:hypothetical protein